MNTTPTPRPWTANKSARYFGGVASFDIEIRDASGHRVVRIDRLTDDRVIPFILRAVNSHDVLVEALDNAMAGMERRDENLDAELGFNRTIAELNASGILSRDIIQAREALALAKETK